MKIAIIVILLVALGWGAWLILRWNSSPFEFGVRNETGALIPDVAVSFNNGRSQFWDIGAAGLNGFAIIGNPPGPIPNSADIAWVDKGGVHHEAHVQVTPVPPPTRTSFSADARIIAFVIKQDNSVVVVYHDPEFTQ